MDNRTSSEILRELWTNAGTTEYCEALWSILDRLDAAISEREKVPDAAPVVPNIVKWTAFGLMVFGYDSNGTCWHLRASGDRWIKTGEQRREPSERDIDLAKAIALQPDIAKTHPLPPVKPDLTTEPDATANLGELASEDVTGLKNALEAMKSDLDSARAECERLRGLIHEYIDVATKTLSANTNTDTKGGAT